VDKNIGLITSYKIIKNKQLQIFYQAKSSTVLSTALVTAFAMVVQIIMHRELVIF